MATVATTNFADRLAEAVEHKRSQLVVGLDPRPDLLPVELKGEAHLGRGEAADACARFCRGLIDAVAPSIEAALRMSSGTRARPAIRSRDMNGIVFQTSARMMIQTDGQNWVSGADPLGASHPRLSVQAKRQENAATTVTIA